MSKPAIAAGLSRSQGVQKKENVSIAWLPVNAKVNFVSTGIEIILLQTRGINNVVFVTSFQSLWFGGIDIYIGPVKHWIWLKSRL